EARIQPRGAEGDTKELPPMSWGLITAMGHVALRTTDLEASIHDAVDVLGLRVTERRPGTAYLAAGGVHHELRDIERDRSCLEAPIHDAVDVLGLRATGRRPGTAYLAAGGVHHELRYIESDSSGLEALGLVARDGDALAEARRRVEEAGFRILAHRPLPDGVDD